MKSKHLIAFTSQEKCYYCLGKSFVWLKKSFLTESPNEKKPTGCCHSFLPANHRPSCRASAKAAGRVSIPWITAARQLLLVLLTPSQDTVTSPTPLNLSLFHKLCDTELSLLTCTVLVPSKHLQCSNTCLHGDLRLCLQCILKLKWIWKPILAMEIHGQLMHYTQHLACIPSASHLVSCAIRIILWEDIFS